MEFKFETSHDMEDKFVGCVLGALVGDCFGNLFDCQPSVPKIVGLFLQQRLSIEDLAKYKTLLYTDDSEMARSVGESLLACDGFNAKDMAKRFVKEYYGPRKPYRMYGCHIRKVFRKLKKFYGPQAPVRGCGDRVQAVLRKLKDQACRTDVYAPATKQFLGTGSLGNAAATRTHPVALFCHQTDQNTMLHICRQAARITHSNLDGYNGAILQTLAVRQALNADPKEPLNVMDFLQSLRNVMVELESERPRKSSFPSYCVQIDNIKTALKLEDGNAIEIGRTLGVKDVAPLSVPTAIYCFLRSQMPIERFPTENPFLRALYLSISLGGDTDTIANMACALSGAYHGKNFVPEVLYQQCEDWIELMFMAQKMTTLHRRSQDFINVLG